MLEHIGSVKTSLVLGRALPSLFGKNQHIAYLQLRFFFKAHNLVCVIAESFIMLDQIFILKAFKICGLNSFGFLALSDNLAIAVNFMLKNCFLYLHVSRKTNATITRFLESNSPSIC